MKTFKSSLIPLKTGKKTKEPYFGTYHHSTSAASKKVRAVVKDMFTDAFAFLPFGRDDELRILDVGCGLGFLSCVSAEFYKNARITGIDTFKHTSLKRSSLERAKENARILGFSDRMDFKKDKFSYLSVFSLCSISSEDFTVSSCALILISFCSIPGISTTTLKKPVI
jgi:SAM-dependent methyltransferase